MLSQGLPPAVNRRALLGGAARAFAALVGSSACRKNAALVCDGPSTGLPTADLQLRATVEYVDTSPQPDRACVNCALYVAAPAEGKCGACKIVRGPIHPKGTCKVFLRKPEGGVPT
jgi:hypothetical protein